MKDQEIIERLQTRLEDIMIDLSHGEEWWTPLEIKQMEMDAIRLRTALEILEHLKRD